MLFRNTEIDGLNIFYREAGERTAPKLLLLHGFPASSHQYRNLMPALAGRFHVIAPDYPGFGNSDMPDPKTFPYTFDKTSEIIESFLKKVGFTRFGLYVQDYGGPVGFRIVTRRPEWLEWLIIQNTNAYEVGFTAVWDGLRGAYWKNRTAEAEKPLEAFLQPETVKLVYTHGHPKPELISPDNWNMDLHLPRSSQCAARPARFLLRLPHERAALPSVAGVPERSPAEDDHLLGAGRHLLHARRRRGIPQGSSESGNAPAEFRSLRRRRLLTHHRRQDNGFLRTGVSPMPQ